MANSINGVQLNSKFGADFNFQYGVPDTSLTNTTTLSNNPLYNLVKVLFEGKQTDNIAYNQNAIMINGLKTNPQTTGNKLYTLA
jgi:hypothetical protein